MFGMKKTQNYVKDQQQMRGNRRMFARMLCLYLLFTCMMVFTISRKEGWHSDEIFTYGLANDCKGGDCPKTSASLLTE